MIIRITVLNTVPFERLHEYDQRGVVGVRYYEADSTEAALDEFHNNVPIKVLDDFAIDAEPAKE